ncbi:unnamed protein product [Caenorhabditis nigoni]|uniref:Uncharacterized protein n=1 Tax=Caenorhabditis nigoni TaxID=1611254 RepID=A0A2G5UE27_9PELO|nr:hypothetical protein B9Z55_016179 [Caenorhabditis nigoni]
MERPPENPPEQPNEKSDVPSNHILKKIVFRLLFPFWFLCTCLFKFYTYLRPFRLAHFMFFHTALVATLSFIPIVYQKKENGEKPEGFIIFNMHSCIILPVCGYLLIALKEANRKVQNLNHVILGFLGMIISVWTLFGCIIAIQFRFYSLIFGSIYILALCLFFGSYLMICNGYMDLYLILPAESQPFFGIKANVVLFGFFHLTVSIASFFLTKFWPICSLLLLASFIFSINAWSCFFTGSYMLCEHRVREDDLLKSPIDGIICHVAVRRNAERMKHPNQLPTDFQFDDILDISRLNYTKSEDVL